jgi:hypothetical protein
MKAQGSANDARPSEGRHADGVAPMDDMALP